MVRYMLILDDGVRNVGFTVTNDQFSVDDCRIRIPNLGSGSVRKNKTKPAPVKQEINAKLNYG
jgi:hypothetical protein